MPGRHPPPPATDASSSSRLFTFIVLGCFVLGAMLWTADTGPRVSTDTSAPGEGLGTLDYKVSGAI